MHCLGHSFCQTGLTWQPITSAWLFSFLQVTPEVEAAAALLVAEGTALLVRGQVQAAFDKLDAATAQMPVKTKVQKRLQQDPDFCSCVLLMCPSWLLRSAASVSAVVTLHHYIVAQGSDRAHGIPWQVVSPGLDSGSVHPAP